MTTLTPFGPLGTTDDTQEHVYDRMTVTSNEHLRKTVDAVNRREERNDQWDVIDRSRALRSDLADTQEEISQLKQLLADKERQIEELEVDKAAYRETAVAILRGRRAVLNTTAWMAQRWGKMGYDPEEDPEFEEKYIEERRKMKANAMQSRENERHVDRTAAEWRPEMEERLKNKKSKFKLR